MHRICESNRMAAQTTEPQEAKKKSSFGFVFAKTTTNNENATDYHCPWRFLYLPTGRLRSNRKRTKANRENCASCYLRKPAIMRSSACCSVRPSVRSFKSCSPAIFPIAASWISWASGWFASSAGRATTEPSSDRMASHSEWPVQRWLPMMVER